MDSIDNYIPPDSLNLFAISPKEDCPHEESLDFSQIASHLVKEKLKAPCKDCNATHENWMCLICYDVFCSRYSNSHMVKHNEITGHQLAQSFADGSFWCYSCDSYVYSKNFHTLAIKFSTIKFPESTSDMIDMDTLAKEISGVDAEHRVKEKDEGRGFSKKELVQGIKEKKFRRIVFLTGAGISVSAGIPDFRSESGIYAQLGKCDLPYPEAIFEIGYFKEHPETFYKLAKAIMNYKAQPTVAHNFIRMIADEGLLLANFTQNVDGLEIDAGVDQKYLIEAHGHLRSAHCAECSKEHDVEELKKFIQEEKIYRCTSCNGPVKPDIIFFGEALPANFYTSVQKLAEGDLVIVMGTSLRVFPFASLVGMIEEKVPIVLINRENTSIKRENFLFLQGDIDERLKGLIGELGWDNWLKDLRSKFSL